MSVFIVSLKVFDEFDSFEDWDAATERRETKEVPLGELNYLDLGFCWFKTIYFVSSSEKKQIREPPLCNGALPTRDDLHRLPLQSEVGIGLPAVTMTPRHNKWSPFWEKQLKLKNIMRLRY